MDKQAESVQKRLIDASSGLHVSVHEHRSLCEAAHVQPYRHAKVERSI